MQVKPHSDRFNQRCLIKTCNLEIETTGDSTVGEMPDLVIRYKFKGFSNYRKIISIASHFWVSFNP